MIQMSHVFKTYPNQVSALSDINVEIPSGEFVFIAGPGGSGKTTLLRLLYGAERPTGGEVTVDGIRLTERGCSKVYRLRRRMGIISRDLKLLQDRTVGENVAFPLEVTGHTRSEARVKTSEILSQVKLQEKEADSIVTLSAGEQQRVAIARALVNDPVLVVADEPTESLDAQTAIDLMEMFNDLHLKGTSVVFATHDTDLIQRYPYPVIRLLSGKRVDDNVSDAVRTET
jgi:cell division transport system ATP-binding protein